MNNKSKKKKGIQVGNYIVTLENGEMAAIKITAVSGNWNIRYREDNPLYLWLKNNLKTEEGKNILHIVFATFFAACNAVPDREFVEDVIGAFNRSVERAKPDQPELSDAEDRQIIEEERNKFKERNNESKN